MKNLEKHIKESLNHSPQIIKTKSIIRTNLFEIQSMDVLFSIGIQRTLERLKQNKSETVLIVPFSDARHIILITEYSAGTNKYELLFPRGSVNLKESIIDAANRELKEEIGLGANKLTFIKTL